MSKWHGGKGLTRRPVTDQKGDLMEPKVFDPTKNYNDKQKELTEYNPDGDTGYQDDIVHDKRGTPECCEKCATAGKYLHSSEK